MVIGSVMPLMSISWNASLPMSAAGTLPVIATIGTESRRAVPIPVNTLLQPADYRFFVENSRARVVVCDQMHHETIRKALEGYDEEPVEVIVTNGRVEGARVLEDLLEQLVNVSPTPIELPTPAA